LPNKVSDGAGKEGSGKKRGKTIRQPWKKGEKKVETDGFCFVIMKKPEMTNGRAGRED